MQPQRGRQTAKSGNFWTDITTEHIGIEHGLAVYRAHTGPVNGQGTNQHRGQIVQDR